MASDDDGALKLSANFDAQNYSDNDTDQASDSLLADPGTAPRALTWRDDIAMYPVGKALRVIQFIFALDALLLFVTLFTLYISAASQGFSGTVIFASIMLAVVIVGSIPLAGCVYMHPQLHATLCHGVRRK